MPGRHKRLDQVEQLTVGAVLDPPRRVVLEPHATAGQLSVQLGVGVAVEVGQDDAVGPHALAGEQVDDLGAAGPNLGVNQDRRAGLPAPDCRRVEPPLLQPADPLV